MRKLRRCKKCLMADTKPGVALDEYGWCQACVNHAKRDEIDYHARWQELTDLCDSYRRSNGAYDCIIPASGGKDSWYQVHVLKNIFNMNPLIVKVCDPYTGTRTGAENLRNMCEYFDVDLHTITPSPKVTRKLTKIAFEKFGSPTWPVDRPIYAAPLKLAYDMSIPFIIYGEDVSYQYGGVSKEETASAKKQIYNDVAKDVSKDLFLNEGIAEQEFESFLLPNDYVVENTAPYYLSYFTKWSGLKNVHKSTKMGFQELGTEWDRKGYIESYDQIDSIGYLINVWMKVPKFGFGRVTDVVGYWIRDDVIDREEGIKLIREHDKLLDPKILADFLDYTGYTVGEFFKIVKKHTVKYDDEINYM